MPGQELGASALLAAAALHGGFQLTVSVMVYPALVAAPASGWSTTHARHCRRIVPVVVLCYGAVVAASAWVLAAGPRTPAVLVSVAAGVAAVGVTAAVAGPTHGRLGREGPRPELLHRLVRADRVRLAVALVALVAAAVGAATAP